MSQQWKRAYQALWQRQKRKIVRMEKLLISAHAQLQDHELKAVIESEIQERKRGVKLCR